MVGLNVSGGFNYGKYSDHGSFARDLGSFTPATANLFDRHDFLGLLQNIVSPTSKDYEVGLSLWDVHFQAAMMSVAAQNGFENPEGTIDLTTAQVSEGLVRYMHSIDSTFEGPADGILTAAELKAAEKDLQAQFGINDTKQLASFLNNNAVKINITDGADYPSDGQAVIPQQPKEGSQSSGEFNPPNNSMSWGSIVDGIFGVAESFGVKLPGRNTATAIANMAQQVMRGEGNLAENILSVFS